MIRTDTGEIKAYPNTCLHRGRRLKDHDGHCSEIRCSFHGFAWALDGALADVPAQWDFPHVTGHADEFHLPECKVGTWAGFVFINPDPGAEPLEDFIGELAEHFQVWNLEDRYVEAHVSKVIRANWKITQEAFCEAFHVNATHPQILPYLGDTNSQVDVWDTFARVITPGGTPSPLLGWDPTEDEMLRSMLDVRVDQDPPFTLKDGQTARASAAAASRERWRPAVGDRVDGMSDAEMMDSLDYTLFPNFHPWGAFNRIVYRFRPNGDDHRSSIMEVLFLAPFKGKRPPPAPIHHLGVDEAVDQRARTGDAGQGVRSGHVQHVQRAARPRGVLQARRHAEHVPGVEGPLAAPAARRVDRRASRRARDRQPLGASRHDRAERTVHDRAERTVMTERSELS